MENTLLMELARKDPRGLELYTKLLDAKIEFLQYMEPIVTAEIQESVKDKHANPKHWRSQMFGIKKSKVKEEQPELTKKHKKLLLIFHPDKNSERFELAEVFTKILFKWIAAKNKDKIKQLSSSDNPWELMELFYKQEFVDLNAIDIHSTFEEKEFYVHSTESMRWFHWNPKIDMESFV